MLKDFVRVNQSTNVISLRYFNPVGAYTDGKLGELPKGVPTNLMPFITQSAIGKRGPLQVFGDDYNTPDGSCIRDYIHVMDLAQAHIVALRRLEKKGNKAPYEVFNIGTGEGVSVFELIQSFERTSGRKLEFQVSERRAGDIEQIWADASLANEELGWKAKLSLDDMTRSAWKWELNLAEKNLK